MTDGVVELALVGAGRMGRMHLRALDPAGGRTAAVRVTDVVEPIEATRAALRGRGYRVHATLADLLAARRPDGVVVAAPTDRHAEVARAASHGKQTPSPSSSGAAPPRCGNGGRRRGVAGCCSGIGGVERGTAAVTET